jgi:hypothetical protein
MMRTVGWQRISREAFTERRFRAERKLYVSQLNTTSELFCRRIS